MKEKAQAGRSRLTMKVEVFDRIVVNANDSWAVAQNLSRHTVAFVDLNKPVERMTSGILVSIGGHLFVATAADAVPAQPEGRLSFVVPKTKTIDAGALPILRSGKIESEWPDVGFLELDPAGALPVLGKEAIGLDRISLRGPGHPECRCLLFGYSSERIRTEQTDPSQLHLTFRPVCYSNAPIKPENWPGVSSADPASDQAVDIFLPYDPEEETWQYEENEGDDNLPEPRGAGGGGLWQGSTTKVELWNAEGVQLLGIQSRWNEKEKYVRGCQIIHWLRLLHEHYSALRPALVAAFPELA
ncbi:MAG: hypothetical protein ABR915_04020 [Thermoguttaceae bacterium]|jgi:hypothetical protein